jgi:hypothetical protein
MEETQMLGLTQGHFRRYLKANGRDADGLT